jgi:hypothetical protein
METDTLNDSFNNIVKQLEETDIQISNFNLARKKAKIEYEKIWAVTILKTKLNKPEVTQTDLKAEAINACYEAKLEMMTLEAEYSRFLLRRKTLTDELDILKEKSYNQRLKDKLIRYT